MVGYKPQDGDDVAIVEDVVTAGTAVRESIELFKHVADVNIKALFVSVDRMERGTRECSTLDELRQDYGIQVFPIVTVREVIAFLHNNSIDGKVYIDDEMKAKMEAYLEEYGARNEMIYLLALDGKNKPLGVRKVAEGSICAANINLRRIMEEAAALRAPQIYLAHNHISNLAFPSPVDISTTQTMRTALAGVGIELLDHLVFVDGDMVSMRDSGMMK